MLSATLLSTLLLAVPQGIPDPPVVVNEFSYDEVGGSGDFMEYAELYNRSAAPVDLTNWTLELNDAGTPQSYPITPGTVLQPQGFWVVGDNAAPNVNQIIGTSDVFGNSNGAITLKDPTGTIVDTVHYEVNKGLISPSLTEGEGVWGNYYTSLAIFTSIARFRDGYDTNNNGRDFRLVPWTPGASNDLPNKLTYFEVFDGLTPASPVPDWSGSFQPPFVIDPTVATMENPSIISPSPAGGLAGIMWDPVGGGNAAMLLSEPVADVVLEGYFYFDATLRPVGQYETWSLGVRGTTLTFHNHVDPAGDLAQVLGTGSFTANGNTGLALEYVVCEAFARLYLVDENDGGTDQVVLGSVDLTAGVNDGWQRVRLQAVGDRVDAFFGGTPGCGDGTRMSGTTTTTSAGGVYMGYREALAQNGNTRPPTFDLLVVAPPNQLEVETIGNSVATTQATPAITVNSLPVIGNPTWEIRLSGLIPATPSVLALGLQEQQPPLSLAALGGQPGSFVYVVPTVTLPVNPTPMGTFALPAPLPCFSNIVGTALYWQALDVDPALTVGLKLGNTAGLKTVLGR